MSFWVAGAAVGSAVIGGVASNSAANKAASASNRAAGLSADAENRKLDYLMKNEELPQKIREEALTGLQGYYKVPGQPLGQQELISRARNSPLYDAIMGTKKSGEESILRSASATGGLRSGNVQGNLYDYNTRLENDALLQSFNQEQGRDDYERSMNLQGLSGLAQLPSNVNAIGQSMSNVGSIQAQGLLGGAQAKQQGYQNTLDNTLGIANLGLQAYKINQLNNQNTPKI